LTGNNLTIIEAKATAGCRNTWLRIRLKSSLPCRATRGKTSNQQRGHAVFEKASPRSEKLNGVGYGTTLRSIWSIIRSDLNCPDRKPIWKPINRRSFGTRVRHRLQQTFHDYESTDCPLRRGPAPNRAKWDEYLELLANSFPSGDRAGPDVRATLASVTAASFTICDFMQMLDLQLASPMVRSLSVDIAPEHLEPGARSKPASTVLPVPPFLAAVAPARCPLALTSVEGSAPAAASGRRPSPTTLGSARSGSPLGHLCFWRKLSHLADIA